MKDYLAKFVEMRKGDAMIGCRSTIYEPGDEAGESNAVREVTKFVFDHHALGFAVISQRTVNPFCKMSEPLK